MAPSTTSALHPIVIPPAQVPPHFTTLGTGLLHASYPREAAATLSALLLSTPSLLENKDKPKPWWRAQCLLYGLGAPEKRTVQELRSSLELALLKSELEVPAAIVELEHRENGKFRKLNAQVRDATGVGAGESKGKIAPKAAGGAAKNVTNKGKKVAPKDPLKAVKSAGKVTKSQPAKKTAAPKNNSVTVNLTVNVPPAPASKAAGKKAQSGTAPAKPRAKKPAISASLAQPKSGASDPTYFGGQAGSKGVGPKQVPKPRGGGAPKAESRPAPIKKEPGAPRVKQTARCSARGRGRGRGRGGTGQTTSRVKKEVETPVWPKQEYDQSISGYGWGDGISEHNDGVAYSDHYEEGGYSDQYEEGGYSDQYDGYELDAY